jgi:hypothetical protein
VHVSYQPRTDKARRRWVRSLLRRSTWRHTSPPGNGKQP